MLAIGPKLTPRSEFDAREPIPSLGNRWTILFNRFLRARVN